MCAARALKLDRDITGPAMEVWAILGMNGFEAIWDIMNNRRLGVFWLSQADQSSLAASRASQRFVPLIGHRRPLFGIPYDNGQIVTSPSGEGHLLCRISLLKKAAGIGALRLAGHKISLVMKPAPSR
jgi:hypothetical protein